MPALIALLGSFLASALPGIVARILAAVGMGVVSYVGVTALLNQAVSMLHSRVGGLPSDIANLLGIAGFDVFLSLVISAKFGIVSFLIAHRGLKRLTFTEGS